MSSAKPWFVQTGFGTILGPMPADVIHEMVRTAELVRSDQVREGADGEWRRASEVPGLFTPIALVDSQQKFAEPAIADETAIESIGTTPHAPKPNTAQKAVSDSMPRKTESYATEQATSAPPLNPESTPHIASPLAKPRLIPPSVPALFAISDPPPISAEPKIPVTVESHLIEPQLELPGELLIEDVSEIRAPPPEDDLLLSWRSERDRLHA